MELVTHLASNSNLSGSPQVSQVTSQEISRSTIGPVRQQEANQSASQSVDCWFLLPPAVLPVCIYMGDCCSYAYFSFSLSLYIHVWRMGLNFLPFFSSTLRWKRKATRNPSEGNPSVIVGRKARWALAVASSRMVKENDRHLLKACVTMNPRHLLMQFLGSA